MYQLSTLSPLSGPALLVSSRGNSARKGKSAAGQKSIASASHAHLAEISAITPANDEMAPNNAHVYQNGNNMTLVNPHQKQDKRSMALADNTTPDDAPITPEYDEVPPPDYDTVVQINARGTPGLYPRLSQS